jgi:hypothetical protein
MATWRIPALFESHLLAPDNQKIDCGRAQVEHIGYKRGDNAG